MKYYFGYRPVGKTGLEVKISTDKAELDNSFTVFEDEVEANKHLIKTLGHKGSPYFLVRHDKEGTVRVVSHNLIALSHHQGVIFQDKHEASEYYHQRKKAL